jgi:hypothetical protein
MVGSQEGVVAGQTVLKHVLCEKLIQYLIPNRVDTHAVKWCVCTMFSYVRGATKRKPTVICHPHIT